MRIFTLSFLMLGCFVLVSGAQLDGKLLRALQDIKHTHLGDTEGTDPNIDDPLSILEPNNPDQARPSLLIPVYSHNKNPKLEQRPPDKQSELRNVEGKMQPDIIIQDGPPQEKEIADIIQLGNINGVRKHTEDKDNMGRLRELEITQPENTIKSSDVVSPSGARPGDLQINVMTDSDDIFENTRSDIMLPDTSNDEENLTGFVPQESENGNDTMITTNSDLHVTQTQHNIANDWFSETPDNSVSDKNIAKEENFRNSHQQTVMDINNDLNKQINQHNNSTEEPQKCSLRQTMAWQVCNKRMPCSSTCKSGDDCTFPYCNSLGLCECREAECSSDRMCYFWRIECHGQFKCRNSKCICEKP